MIKQPGQELGNSDICINPDGTLSYKVWVNTGSMIINRDCLSPSDSLHIYNLVVAHNLNPDEYGIEHPRTSEFKDWSRDRLVHEILQLRDTIDSAMRHGFL